MAKFISPFTDYGFKLLFGQEATKDLLIDFLNELLKGEKVVKDLTYLDKEIVREAASERGVIYDIYCTSDTGEHFIVEMQNNIQAHFHDRAVYYVARALDRQGKRGTEWQFDIKSVYGIFFMNFTLDSLNGKMRTDVVLSDRDTGRQFSDAMRLIFLELPHFNKTEEECETNFEKWIYILKHMETLTRMPFEAQRKIFAKLASVADIDKMEEPMRSQYEETLRVYRDNILVLDGAREEGMKLGREEGLQKGMQQGMRKAAKEMKQLGLPVAQIMQVTGLSREEIEAL